MLLTNAHVARGAASVTADLPDGTTVVVDVVGAIVGRDAALLDAAPLVEAGLVPAARGPGVGDGDRVVVVGHPGGTFRVDGTVVAQVQRRAAYGGASDVLITASAAQGGQSGGALLDRGGAVVGLVAARDPVTGSVVAYRIGDLVDEPVGAPPPC